MEYIIFICAMVAIYTIAAEGLNILVGLTGLTSVMQAAFLGLSAYIYALSALKLGVPLGPSLLIALVGSASAAYLLGYLTLRVRGDYFALITFALAIIIYHSFNNLISITGGPMGVVNVPQLLGSPRKFLLLVVLSAVASVFFVRLVGASPYGRLLKSIREDEMLAASLGKNVQAVKMSAFIISSIFAGLAGVFYASYVTFIDPTSFAPMESIIILAMLLIGGAGSAVGPLLGALFLVAIPELLRFLGLPGNVAAATRQLIFGLLMTVLMVFRPKGLIGEYRLY